jgi:hypothetical protein
MRGVSDRCAAATDATIGLSIALHWVAAGAPGADQTVTTTMRFTRLAVLITAVLVTACSDAPTSGDQISLAELRKLEQVEAAERQRVALAAAESQATFDSLHAQFLLGGIIRTVGGVTTGLVSTAGNLLSDVLGLLVCEPERYVATVKVVGREGGMVRVGQHTLEIPRNALRKPTVITAERPTGEVATVRFSPHGLEFERSATLTMDYSHCSYSKKNRMAYTDEKLNILEYPPSTDDRRREQVEAQIDHFSRYAVAY